MSFISQGRRYDGLEATVRSWTYPPLCVPARCLKEPAEEDDAESCTGSPASVGGEQRRDVVQEAKVLKVMQMTRALEGTVEGSGLCGGVRAQRHTKLNGAHFWLIRDSL